MSAAFLTVLLLHHFANIDPPISSEIAKLKDHIQVAEAGCKCHSLSCSCCLGLTIPVVHKHFSACVEIDMLQQDLVDLKFVLNGDTVVDKKKISLPDPPPLCAKIPDVPFTKICVELYDITIKPEVGACVKLAVKTFGQVVYTRVGCFKVVPREQNRIEL